MPEIPSLLRKVVVAMSRTRTRTRTCVGVLLCTAMGNALAQPLEEVSAGSVWQAVGNQRLDALRGGFNMGNGLMVSFGITSAVFINGALVTETTLNINRLADLSSSEIAQLGQKLNTLSLVQNGPGNTMASNAAAAPNKSGSANATVSSIAGAAGGTIIQNTLNNQHILYQTTVNASSNGLGMVRTGNLQNTLTEAIQQSIGQR